MNNSKKKSVGARSFLRNLAIAVVSLLCATALVICIGFISTL